MRALSVQLLLLATVLSMGGCATHYSPSTVSDPYGFFSGLWHGLVFPYALLVNIISWILEVIGVSALDSIQIIGRPNTGIFYYVGFGLGCLTYSGGAAR